ncbi:MAG: hypothetical protein IJ220_05445 [Clostridia bacterium]|nr:hypothetical protein [Clostridia bacterium]
MSEDLSKIALMSGKLSGTKTLDFVLENLEEPDEVESFLKSFIKLKIDFDVSNEPVYINDDQDFLEHLNEIENSEYISIYANENFSRLYITVDVKKTYIIRINKVNSNIIAKFISKEKPIKFSLNSFNFIKWCVTQKIDMRNIYDIPTYIKILTNEVDPFKTIENYIEQYTHYKLSDDDNETNSIIIGNFIYEFGKFLNENAKRFGIDSVCKLINENSYYEAIMNKDSDSCTIKFAYSNLKQAIDTIVDEKEKEYKEKAYIISPLGRIAIKYGHNVKDIIEELYAEDISITILNELYNNNIHVTLDAEDNYVVNCKYKNISNVFSLITAILDDIFYTMFKQTFEATIKCEVK